MDSASHNPNRAIRPPPGTRRGLFHAPSRRGQAQPSVIRPDTATTIFSHSTMEDELVERDDKGGYKVNTPSTMYKHLAMGMRGEGEEEEGM